MEFTWLLVAGAILAEIAAALLLRASDGFRKRGAAWLALASFAGAFYLVSRTLVVLPVSSVYPVWAGGGTAGVAAIGMLALGERRDAIKLWGVVLVIAGIVVLNLATNTSA